jgi:hypothetical protein
MGYVTFMGGPLECKEPQRKETSLKRRRHTALYGRTLFLNKVLFLDTAA